MFKSIIDKAKAIINATFFKKDGTFSITKAGIFLTAVCTVIAGIPGVFTAAQLAVPPIIAEFAKYAALFLAFITAYKVKFDLEKLKEKANGTEKDVDTLYNSQIEKYKK
ncbi:MAG: hypothetical protein PHN88_14895 [Ignavibacteria bacterium]|nr:hypothetical protein [Ignavibacteria bacterium]